MARSEHSGTMKEQLPLSKPPENLFILRFSALGDVTNMVPVVRSIQAFWPTTRITWCLASLEARLVGDMSGIETVLFDKSLGWRAYSQLRQAMRGRRFDALMHAQYSMRSNLASRCVRSRIRLGYDRDRSKDLHGLFITHRIPRASGQHVVDSYFSFAETLGVAERDLRWDIPISDEDREFAREQIPDSEPTLIVSPCSSHRLRNWLPERYAKVADYAATRHGFRVVLCGGPSAEERMYGEAIEAAMSQKPHNLIGKDTVKKFLALLERATLLMTVDSGPMHMATAAGTPVLGLHAASNPERSGPYLSRRWCVNRYDDAARKFLKKPAASLEWGTKIEYPGVMDLVTVEDVKERLDAFVAASSSGGSASASATTSTNV
jgi:heptosyltransferase I